LGRPHSREARGLAVEDAGQVNTEFVGALEELSADVGIPLDDLVHTVESALASAYKRAFDVEGDVRVHLDPSSAGIEVERHLHRADGSETVEKLPVENF